MDKKKLLRLVLPCLFILGVTITACEQPSGVDELEESLSDVPHLNLIEGAESVVASVNKNRRTSNFTIQLEGMEEQSGIEAGEYAAFCALWDVPINSSGETYGNVSLHSIENEPYWQDVNYLVNQVDRYFDEHDDLSWLEVQIALWSIMDHKKFDMSTIPDEDLPSYVREGGYSRELIDSILEDVEQNNEMPDTGMPGNRAFYAQFDEAQDQIIIIPGSGEKEKGFGVRFRNFTSSAGQQEIYLGVGDLGAGANREQKHATFSQNGSTSIDFAYNPGDDEISASAGGDYVIYSDLSANMPANCSINDVDRAELWVAARDAGTTVSLSGTVMGETFSVSADGDGVNQRFVTLQNIDISGGFTLSADLALSGTFTDGERGKVDLILGCPTL